MKAGLAALFLAVVLFFASPAAAYFRGVFVSWFAPREDSVDPSFAGMSREALIGRVIADETVLSRIKYQAALYELLAQENAKLRSMLSGTTTPEGILARVVSRPSETLYDTILVDRGTESGIGNGALAVYQGIALGKVVSAGKGSALVQLFSSPGAKEDVIIGKPAAIAIADGDGGGAFDLTVPEGITVSVGDPVRVQASASLLLGTVVSVSPDQSKASQEVYLRSPLSLSDLDFIEIASLPK